MRSRTQFDRLFDLPAASERPGQLRMFMTPSEIKRGYAPHSGDKAYRWKTGLETDDALWDRKAKEAEEGGITASIARNGVKYPATLSDDTREVVGGHHRIAGGDEAGDKLMPVVHTKDYTHAAEDMRHFGGYR